MPDREKVIKSLKWFRDRDSWREVIMIHDDHAEVRKLICDNAIELLKEQEAQRDYEASVEMAEYCERYEQTYNPEDGSM